MLFDLTGVQTCALPIDREEHTSELQSYPGLHRQLAARTVDRHLAIRSVNQLHAEREFQLLYRGAERGLGDKAGIRGPAEMSELFQGNEVLQLADAGQFLHGEGSINYQSIKSNNTIQKYYFIY